MKLFFHPKYFLQWQPNKNHHQVGKDQLNILFSKLVDEVASQLFVIRGLSKRRARGNH